MAFVEPSGIVTSSTRKAVGKSKKKRRAGTTRRRVVTGGVGRTSPVKKTKSKEKKTMAKSRRKRSPAQIAATERMLAANKAKRGTRKSPAKRKTTKRRRTARARKPADIQALKTGASQVRVTPGRKLTPRAKTYVSRVKKQVGRRRTTTYRVSAKGKAGMLVRENPANRTKAIISAAVGFGTGLLAADILDRFVATRKGDAAAAYTGGAALAKIKAPADGTRVFAQAAATGVAAIGAYALRKKSTVATYALGGMATAFAAKGLMMVITDMIMPKLLPAKGKDGTAGRLAYGDLAGPRGYMPPFRGKSTLVGPQAAGSVGAYGCTRVPVDPSRYSGGREHCKPWPFEQGESRDCIETVNLRPPMQRTPTPRPQPVPSIPRPVPSIPRPVSPGGFVIQPEADGYGHGDAVGPDGWTGDVVSVEADAGFRVPGFSIERDRIVPVRINTSSIYTPPTRPGHGAVKGPVRYRYPGR